MPHTHTHCDYFVHVQTVSIIQP